MPDTLTAADIQAELTTVRASIAVIAAETLAAEEIGGKQVAYASSAKLEALYRREEQLEQKLIRAERGGIRVRYGVVAR